MGTELYIDFIKNSYGLEPLIAYGGSELGYCLIGLPNRKVDLHPVLRGCYLEFLNEKNEIKKIDELKKNNVYEIIGTPFDSMLIKYKVDDMVRVVDVRDDGMPVFNFESRKQTVLNIYGWFSITEAIAVKVLHHAGLKMSDNWLIVKRTDPKEHLLFLMEKDWKYSENTATKRLFNALKDVNPEFQNYTEDFKIRDPSEIIKTTYLKKGTFRKYSSKMEKLGKPISHYKPPKLVNPEKAEIIEELMAEV